MHAKILGAWYFEAAYGPPHLLEGRERVDWRASRRFAPPSRGTVAAVYVENSVVA